MNYSSDKPIETKECDKLGRSTFAEQLGRTIYSYHRNDGLIIGLFGKWGAGKTSVINMAINEVNSLSANDNNKPMIMKFNPWNYSDKNNLISLFFQSLKNNILAEDNEAFKIHVGKALNDYAGAFDTLSMFPIVGTGLAALFKNIASGIGKHLMQGVDLDKTREKLEKALTEANKRIIIVIDDIDRLTNQQIRDVFQLVKQVADFPNVIYLLAMDRDIVCSALNEVHNIGGNEYLEKIIQVPFELPNIGRSKLQLIFFEQFNQILKDISDQMEYDSNYLYYIYRNCVAPFVHTLRDINRLFNVFQFKCEMLYKETSLEDMLGITTLEVLKPDLYKWICNNKEIVCGGPMHSLLLNKGNKTDFQKIYYDEFTRLNIDPDLAIRCISSMFPVFANDVKYSQYSYQRTSDIRSKMRVAQGNRFDLYFMNDMDNIKVPRSIINKCIYNFDSDDLKTVMAEINSQDNIIFLLEEIDALVEKIPYERLSLLASSMLSFRGEFRGEDPNSPFMFTALDIAMNLVTDIVNRLNSEEERYNAVRFSLEKADESNIGTLAHFINRIEQTFNGRAEEAVEEDKFIELVHLKELEEIYVNKIRIIVHNKNILNMDKSSLTFSLWERLDHENAVKYLRNLFADEVNKLRFVCSTASRWRGTGGDGWSFSASNYSRYIQRDEIYTTIQHFNKSQLNELTPIEQIKLASFVLLYDRNNCDEMDDVSEREAQVLVEQWKKDTVS